MLYEILFVYFYIFQLITTIPASVLPKKLCTWGRRDEGDSPDVGVEAAGSETDLDVRRGQILWVRGLTRLQQQVRLRSFLAMSVICCISVLTFNIKKYKQVTVGILKTFQKRKEREKKTKTFSDNLAWIIYSSSFLEI